MFIDPVIYAIINTANDKFYVGQTYNKLKRFGEHKKTLNAHTHCNSYIQRDWNKCGQQLFIFVVLEKCEIENLTIKEQYWIDILKPEYNLAPVAGSMLNYKHTTEAKQNMSNAHKGHKHSEETKRKMSEAKIGNSFNNGRKQTPEHIEIRAKVHRGKITSEETKAKMSAAQKGRLLTLEHKLKLSIAARNRKRPLDVS